MGATLRGFVCLLLALQSASAQQPPQPKILTPSSTRDVLAHPFTSWGTPACDKDGNMYFHGGGPGGAEVLRLSADGNEGKTFKVVEKYPEAKGFIFEDFSISPSGDVYVLGWVGAEHPKVLLFRFDEDGSMEEPINPQIPKGVIPTNIAASDAGTILIFGYYDDTAPPGLRGTSYMAVLDSSGAVRQELHVAVPGLDVAKIASGELPSPAATVGEDLNFYFPGSNQILVMLPDGELVRKIPFDNPEPESRIGRLIVSGGLVVIELDAVNDHQVRVSYLALLNPSGGVVGYYKPSEQLGGWPAMCYSPKQGLIFLKVENKRLKLLTAPLQ
jgi:hypothetical protein